MRNAFLVMGLLLAAPLACSNDKKTTAPSAPDSGPGGGDGGGGNDKPVMLLPDGGCPDPAKAPIYDGVSKCLDKATAITTCEQNSADQSPAGTKVDDPNCGGGCTCENCAAEMFQCSLHKDCVKILLCAQEHNCVGAACYTSGACTSIIDHADGDAGISSDSVSIVQLVNACATKTKLAPYDYTNREGPTCMAGCK